MKHLELRTDEVVGFRPGTKAREVLCQAGLCWVTQEGDPEDHVLRAGETLHLHPRGKVVVFGLEESEVTVQGDSKSLARLRQAATGAGPEERAFSPWAGASGAPECCGPRGPRSPRCAGAASRASAPERSTRE
jgi:hypothetical protein